MTDDDFDALTAMDCTYCGDPPRNIYRKTRNGSFTYNGIDRVDNTRAGDIPRDCSLRAIKRGVLVPDDVYLRMYNEACEGVSAVK